MFEVETGDRHRIVEVTGRGGTYQAVVDGGTYALDVARVADVWSLLVRPAQAGSPGPPNVRSDRSYEVTFGEQLGGELIVYVNRRAVAVRLHPLSGGPDRRHIERRAKGRGDDAADARSGPLSVTAPMPGRIVKVLVNVGDAVAARQGVVVVEAMKMENELRSPRAGTVKEVRVAVGALVEARTVLVVIE
jgi:biotin carboxyl carrier protein